jgi:hypothetical protein
MTKGFVFTEDLSSGALGSHSFRFHLERKFGVYCMNALFDGFVSSFDLFGKPFDEKKSFLFADGQIESEAWEMVGGQLWGTLIQADIDRLIANKPSLLSIREGRLFVGQE